MSEPRTAMVAVVQTIQSPDMQGQFRQLLPPSISVDRFTAATLAAIQNFPDVLEADKDSLYRACVAAARRGLVPDKEEGALVIFPTNVGTRDNPRWQQQVQFMPMVKGIIMEMAKAGIRAYAVSVHANDKISLWNDDQGQHVHHEPLTFGDRGELVGVYASAIDARGRTYVEAMAKKDIEQVRSRSKQKDKNTGAPTGTWKTDYDRMAQKSALHRLRKRLPMTGEESAEDSDIDLGAESGAVTAAEDATPTAAAPAQSPPALAAPTESQQDEVLKPRGRSRRPKVMEQVLAATKPPVATQEKQPEPAKAAAVTEDEGDIL